MRPTRDASHCACETHILPRLGEEPACYDRAKGADARWCAGVEVAQHLDQGTARRAVQAKGPSMSGHGDGER